MDGKGKDEGLVQCMHGVVGMSGAGEVGRSNTGKWRMEWVV